MKKQHKQQFNMFPDGDDLPLFSGTPVTTKLKPFCPRETLVTPTMFDCPICQDTGIVKTSIEKDKRPQFCLCPAGQDAKARETLEALPESKRVKRLNQLYGEAGEDSKLLRESMVIDSPMVRMTFQGAKALNLPELINIILGTQKEPLLGIRLIAEMKSLVRIRAYSVAELTALGHGMTETRAQRLLAALELGERLREPRETPVRIKSPADAADLLTDMSGLEQEQMRVVLVDTKNGVIDIQTVYQGSVHTTVIRVCELMRAAVRANATALIIAHNHPSGDPTPSPEDVAITREIVQAAKLLDIDCLDHLVIGEAGKFVSLKERGLGFGG